MTDEVMAMFEKASQQIPETVTVVDDAPADDVVGPEGGEVQADDTPEPEIDMDDEPYVEPAPKGARARKEWEARHNAERERDELRQTVADLKRNQENLLEGLKLVTPEKAKVDPTNSEDALLRKYKYDPDLLTDNERVIALDVADTKEQLAAFRQEGAVSSIDRHIDAGIKDFAGDDTSNQEAIRQSIEFLVRDQEISFTRSVQLNGQKATKAEIRQAAEESVKNLALKYRQAGYNPAEELARIAHEKFTLMNPTQTKALKEPLTNGKINADNLQRSKERAGKANINTQPTTTKPAVDLAAYRAVYGM